MAQRSLCRKGREVVHKQALVLSSWAPVALECSAPLPVALMVHFIHTQWFMEGEFLSTDMQPCVLIYVLTWKKGKKWKEQKLGLNVREHSTSPPHKGFSSSEDISGDLLCGTVVIWAMQVHNKQKASQFEVTTPLNHRKGFSPGICLIGGTTLHLIRCVRKVKLAKIISQLFCLLRRKSYSFKCVTVFLSMHMQAQKKCPAWRFWSFSVLISPLYYFSVGAAEQKEIKTNSNTGKSRKKELLTL